MPEAVAVATPPAVASRWIALAGEPVNLSGPVRAGRDPDRVVDARGRRGVGPRGIRVTVAGGGSGRGAREQQPSGGPGRQHRGKPSRDLLTHFSPSLQRFAATSAAAEIAG